MFELEEQLWWYSGMRSITSSILNGAFESRPVSRILDVGCGTGYSMIWLRKRFPSAETFGVDLSPHAAELWKEKAIDTAVLARANCLPFIPESFDLVTCFDVIYQLEADEARTAVAEFNRVLRRGGLLFIREPAYDWLRGSHDVAVGTKHRFNRAEVRGLLESSGFHIKRATYANSLLFGLALAHRVASRGSGASDVKPAPAPLNWLFGSVLKTEASLLRGVNFPFGLSVVALAQKM